MGLSSVANTALTSLNAAEFFIGAISHNLANANTDGFKQSRPTFATQLPATLNQGVPPNTIQGGTNPQQLGIGVVVEGMHTDFQQGAIVARTSPLQVALQGDGFFILQGAQGRVFTRDGNFRLDADGYLVNTQSDRVLGIAVDEHFQLRTTALEPLRVPTMISAPDANGAAASLMGVVVNSDGRIQGRFSDGVFRDLGQIRLTRFANNSGLVQVGGNRFAAGLNSGLPVEFSSDQSGATTIVGGAAERSNTDVARNLVDLTLASTQFRASLALLDTADRLLLDLTRLNGGK